MHLILGMPSVLDNCRYMQMMTKMAEPGYFWKNRKDPWFSLRWSPDDKCPLLVILATWMLPLQRLLCLWRSLWWSLIDTASRILGYSEKFELFLFYRCIRVNHHQLPLTLTQIFSTQFMLGFWSFFYAYRTFNQKDILIKHSCVIIIRIFFETGPILLV